MTDGIVQEVFNNHYRNRDIRNAFDISDLESIKKELIEKIKQQIREDYYCSGKPYVMLDTLIGDNK